MHKQSTVACELWTDQAPALHCNVSMLTDGLCLQGATAGSERGAGGATALLRFLGRAEIALCMVSI